MKVKKSKRGYNSYRNLFTTNFMGFKHISNFKVNFTL